MQKCSRAMVLFKLEGMWESGLMQTQSCTKLMPLELELALSMT